MRFSILGFILLIFAQSASAEIYAYTNEDGDYVMSQSKPNDREISYAILTDEGDFVRTVKGPSKNVPISHWRPFFLPKEPHPFDGPTIIPGEQKPVIKIDEVEKEDES